MGQEQRSSGESISKSKTQAVEPERQRQEERGQGGPQCPLSIEPQAPPIYCPPGPLFRPPARSALAPDGKNPFAVVNSVHCLRHLLFSDTFLGYLMIPVLRYIPVGPYGLWIALETSRKSQSSRTT